MLLIILSMHTYITYIFFSVCLFFISLLLHRLPTFTFTFDILYLRILTVMIYASHVLLISIIKSGQGNIIEREKNKHYFRSPANCALEKYHFRFNPAYIRMTRITGFAKKTSIQFILFCLPTSI
jgi:hypothetical protein